MRFVYDLNDKELQALQEVAAKSNVDPGELIYKLVSKYLKSLIDAKEAAVAKNLTLAIQRLPEEEKAKLLKDLLK